MSARRCRRPRLCHIAAFLLCVMAGGTHRGGYSARSAGQSLAPIAQLFRRKPPIGNRQPDDVGHIGDRSGGRHHHFRRAAQCVHQHWWRRLSLLPVACHGGGNFDRHSRHHPADCAGWAQTPGAFPLQSGSACRCRHVDQRSAGRDEDSAGLRPGSARRTAFCRCCRTQLCNRKAPHHHPLAAHYLGHRPHLWRYRLPDLVWRMAGGGTSYQRRHAGGFRAHRRLGCRGLWRFDRSLWGSGSRLWRGQPPRRIDARRTDDQGPGKAHPIAQPIRRSDEL